MNDNRPRNRLLGFVARTWRESWFSRVLLLFILFWLTLTFVELGFLISYMHITTLSNGTSFWWTGTDGPYPPYVQPLAVGAILVGIVGIIAPPCERRPGVSPLRARMIGASIVAVGGLALLADAHPVSTPGWVTPVVWLVICFASMSASRRQELLDRSSARIRGVFRH